MDEFIKAQMEHLNNVLPEVKEVFRLIKSIS